MAAGTNKEKGYLQILENLISRNMRGDRQRGSHKLTSASPPAYITNYRRYTVIRYETLNGKYRIRVNFIGMLILALKLILKVLIWD